MSDLFAFGRAAATTASGGDYGLSGDMKKTQYVFQLLGFPGDVNTLKCLITAVEAGLETDSGVLDRVKQQEQSPEYLAVSPFGLLPALKEADYYLAGDSGIMSYLEARGLGKRLRPQNAKLLAAQNYWSDIACSEVQPMVEVLLQEQVIIPMTDAARQADTPAMAQARAALSEPLKLLEHQLADKNFIIGDFSFADIHWTACLHLLQEAGETTLLDDCTNIKAWFQRIQSHKSHSGQNIIAYDLLPKRDDIIQQRLNSVVIDDY